MTCLAIIVASLVTLAILFDCLFAIKPLRRAWRKWWGE